MASSTKKKRRRATAVVERADGRYLLVRDKGRKRYSLPGGKIEQGEAALAAAERELYEETHLRPTRAEFLFTYQGGVNEHQVFRVDVGPDIAVKLRREEIDDFKWWHPEDRELPVDRHVRDIIAKL